MKMTPEHYQHIKQAMQDRLAAYSPEAIAHYIKQIQTDIRVKDWPKRYRWDLLHAAGLTPWICQNLYHYLHDGHIDTALKAIMREIDTTNKEDRQ